VALQLKLQSVAVVVVVAEILQEMLVQVAVQEVAVVNSILAQMLEVAEHLVKVMLVAQGLIQLVVAVVGHLK
jgi:hypothetical protein